MGKTNEPNEQIVYALSNGAMPGLLKLGRTSRLLGERIAELSAATSSPLPFECAYAAVVEDGVRVEQILKQAFASVRLNKKREFYRVTVEEVKAVLVPHALRDATADAGVAMQTHYQPPRIAPPVPPLWRRTYTHLRTAKLGAELWVGRIPQSIFTIVWISLLGAMFYGCRAVWDDFVQHVEYMHTGLKPHSHRHILNDVMVTAAVWINIFLIPLRTNGRQRLQEMGEIPPQGAWDV